MSRPRTLTKDTAPLGLTNVQHLGVAPTPLLELHAVVKVYFPELWPEVEAALSAIAVLKLKHAANPVALFFEGEPAGGKSTVVEMFGKLAAIAYQSDKFTPAAFVSHSSNRSSEELATVDLLPRIKHKVFLTPELGPTFSGREEDLLDKFATLTRVLDGRGLTTDSGVHGQRGYRGDYFFAWLGATTPIPDRIWQIMGKLGSRIVTYKMPETKDMTTEDLLATDGQMPYIPRLVQCMCAVEEYLTVLFELNRASKAATRTVTWCSKDDPEPVRRWIANLALLMAEMRSQPQHEPNHDDKWDRSHYVPEQREGPRRFHSLLNEIAQGHALLYGRTQLTEADLPVVAHIALSSMPKTKARLLRALIEAGGSLTVHQAEVALGVSTPTALAKMEQLGKHRVAVYTLGGSSYGQRGGQPSQLDLAPAWQWCLGLNRLERT